MDEKNIAPIRRLVYLPPDPGFSHPAWPAGNSRQPPLLKNSRLSKRDAGRF
jgi:hypothetical protein